MLAMLSSVLDGSYFKVNVKKLNITGTHMPVFSLQKKCLEEKPFSVLSDST